MIRLGGGMLLLVGLLADWGRCVPYPTAGSSYSPFGPLHTRPVGFFGEPAVLDYGVTARAFYLNDQRIQWSGNETTFAAEGAAYGNYRLDTGDWLASVETEAFFNQPTDKNIFFDNAERRSYAANYDFDPFELSRLNVAMRNGDFQVRVGRMWTPFGRYYTQLWNNQLLDAPFIRTESIQWRETGALFTWDPGSWQFDAGLFNGQDGRDTNSSKALIARIGVNEAAWAVGGSIKWQDGIGSETQKTFNNHVGVDGMVLLGRWRVSGEAIYDEYGLRRTVFDPNDIFWEKSIYFRDLNKVDNQPITGWGHYINLDYLGDVWTIGLSFGQFYPESIGSVPHDRTQTRGIVKLIRSFGRHMQAYGIVLRENDGYIAQGARPRNGTVVLSGLQFTF